MLASRLLKATAVAICFWTLHPRAFAEQRDAAPSSPKAESEKQARKTSVKERKTPVKEKARSGAAAAGNRPTSSPAGAEPGAAAQARTRPMREENVRKAPLASLPPPDTAKPPPRLPEAPREKMRACALEWSKLKL